ncbi:GapS6a family protein [Yersinia enterocolitica]|uniref:GapS6a family protein n=1 Tax=Yersinia TaxID=629 RepID=UPI0005DAA21A|nr:hypothetical protein [Yersinia enterocolitica]CNG28188.1 Uncharacterised protein [Yersinia enterocolitica]HDL7534025.1 hypothetical protein [Yersinia enterocolitica]
MGFLTSTLLSGILYDGFKTGVAITTDFLKEKLTGWLVDDALLEKLSYKVNALKLQDYGEHVIERKLNESSEIQEILKLVQPEQNTNIGSVTQNHCGSGDNIVGNKIIHN